MTVRLSIKLMSLVLVAGCGGGAGIGAQQGGAPVPVLFSPGVATTPQVLPGRQVFLRGVRRSNGTITNFGGMLAPSQPDATVAWDGTGLSVLKTENSLLFDTGAGVTVGTKAGVRALFLPGGTGYARVANGTYTAIGSHAHDNGTAFTAGIFAAGNQTTNAANLPANATYTGQSIGHYFGTTGTAYDTTGTTTLVADFTNRNLTFTETSVSNNAITGAPVSAPGLPMTGTASINGTRYFGRVDANLGGFTGNISGDFYGPNGEETAGRFAMQGSSGRFFGAFTAKR